MYRMMQMVATIISRIMRMFANCSRNSSHRGILGGGVSTLGPYSSSSSAACLAESPRLRSTFCTSMCVK
jgi:hypothetical protein